MGQASSSSSTSSGGGGFNRPGALSRWKRPKKRATSHSGLSFRDFRVPPGFVSNIGVGAFGKVLAMERRDDPSRRFAIKCLLKAKVLVREQLDNCLNELSILRRMDHHAYIVNLFYAFQDESTLYMCSDLMLGGTLQRAMRQAPGGCLVEEPARVCRFAAELVLALQFLHSQNVVHRDVKPDNLLLDALGHLHLSDFNVSLYVAPGDVETAKHEDGWGTRGYRAPEVYLRTGRGFIFACDWWSAGAVVYEMLTGRVPYPKISEGEPSSEMLGRMHAESCELGRIKDEMARDFVRKLLRFDPECRLGCQHGCNSEVMIMTHPFFDQMDWDELERYDPELAMEQHLKTTASTTSNNTGNTPLAAAATGPTPAASAPTPAQGAQGAGAGALDIKDFASNFDPALDHKEKLKVLQRNMGMLGFGDGEGDSDDEGAERSPPLTAAQQELFRDWAFNVDFKLEQQARPQFTLLHTVSSMAPEQIKAWIGQSSADALKALCGEMKSYREQAMKENFDHVMAEITIDKLREENLKLTRRVAELEQALKMEAHAMLQEKAAREQQRLVLEQQQEQLLLRGGAARPAHKSGFRSRGEAAAAADEEEVVLFSSSYMAGTSRPGQPVAQPSVQPAFGRPGAAARPDNTPPQSPSFKPGPPSPPGRRDNDWSADGSDDDGGFVLTKQAASSDSR